MTWTVTRQSQWPTGENIVEVSEGGIDYCNPDALVELYKGSGEFETFDDPREAAEAAIQICSWWRIDHKGMRGSRPKVAAGATLGFTLPFEPSTFKQLRIWASETWKHLEKCSCGKPFKKERWRADDWSGIEFCSERCADKEIEFQQEQEALLAEEENEDA